MQNPAAELAKALRSASRLHLRRGEALGIVSHAYSHFKVVVHAFWCEAVSIPKNKKLKWVKIGELSEYPMGKVDRQIAQKIK
ncbi:MAG: hypothetical protein JNM02_00155 [Anaerolineales bacterium]|nr:hypothetical protein [Anaerolineales bacterium]